MTSSFMLCRFLPFLATLALGASGCSIKYIDDDEGTLTVEWSLDDSFDSDACVDYGGRYLELVVYDWDDDLVREVRPRCDDFSVSIDLPDGAYLIEATLIDRSRRAVTTTLELDVEVDEGREEFVDIDFPVDSIR